jgi:cytoskeletal protein CcmA (bactofilin family)
MNAGERAAMNNPKPPTTGSAATTPKQTLVEEGTRFKGSLTSTCPVLVRGTVEGGLEGPAVTISATGSVSGRVEAGSVSSDGRIAGELEVDSARIAGSVAGGTVVRASSLDIKVTAETGKLQLTFGGSGRSS